MWLLVAVAMRVIAVMLRLRLLAQNEVFRRFVMPRAP
jgi:hypothetical protein